MVFLPGDLIGIKSMLLERQPDTIECLSDAHVRSIDRRQLRELVAQDHPQACGSCSSSPKTSADCTIG